MQRSEHCKSKKYEVPTRPEDAPFRSSESPHRFFLIHLRSVTKQDSRQKPSAFFAHHFGCGGQINPLKQCQPIQQQIYAPRFPLCCKTGLFRLHRHARMPRSSDNAGNQKSRISRRLRFSQNPAHRNETAGTDLSLLPLPYVPPASRPPVSARRSVLSRTLLRLVLRLTSFLPFKNGFFTVTRMRSPPDPSSFLTRISNTRRSS